MVDGGGHGRRVAVDQRVAAEEERYRRLEAIGIPTHPEAAFLTGYDARTVLELGCGSGRISIELARRGVRTLGVDVDRDALEVAARRSALDWWCVDPARLEARTAVGARVRFDAVVCSGRLMMTASPPRRVELFAAAARHLRPGGMVVCGMQLAPGRTDLRGLDAAAESVGLRLAERYAGWDRRPWDPAEHYVVSVHRSEPAPEPAPEPHPETTPTADTAPK